MFVRFSFSLVKEMLLLLGKNFKCKIIMIFLFLEQFYNKFWWAWAWTQSLLFRTLITDNRNIWPNDFLPFPWKKNSASLQRKRKMKKRFLLKFRRSKALSRKDIVFWLDYCAIFMYHNQQMYTVGWPFVFIIQFFFTL